MGMFSKIKRYFRKDNAPYVAVAIVRSRIERPIDIGTAYKQFQREEEESQEKKSQREQKIAELDEKVLYGRALDNGLFGLVNDSEILQERLKIFIERTIDNSTITIDHKITPLTSSDFHYLADKFKEKINTLKEAANVRCVEKFTDEKTGLITYKETNEYQSTKEERQRYLNLANSFTQAIYAIKRKYGIDINEARRVAMAQQYNESLESRIEDTPFAAIAAS